jgi:TonB-dependent starch-binding outer membrane protein SusC
MKKVYRSSTALASVFLLLLFAISFAHAQERMVTGSVKDAQGIPMPGVNVLKKGTAIGTSTDTDGKFRIDATENDILVITFIGYETQEIRVANQTNIDLQLAEDVATLGEVVVVGYGTQRKSDLTGSIASISGESIRTSIMASVDQALQGRVAGVQVTQNSGQPGGVVSIRIRGTTSLTQSSEPLYVIDGIQVSGNGSGIAGFDWQGGAGGQQQAASNPLATLNPNDIESIEVLKDASATAIYGSRAANGVVIITTKRGKRGMSKISYDGYYATQEVYKTFPMMNLREYATYNNEVANEVSTIAANPRFADPTLLGVGTDWQDAIFQLAPMQSHTVTFSGGTDATQYMVSGGYFGQDGIIIGSDFNRFNVRLNLDSEVKKGIRIGTNISLSRKNEEITLNDGGDGVVSQAAQMPPHIPVRDFNGEFAGPDAQNASPQISSNPVGLALLRTNTVLNNRLMANLYVDATIIKGLSFRSEISTDIGNTLNKAFVPTYQWGRLINAVSQLGQRADMSFFWLWKNYATFQRNFGLHDLTAMAGIEAQRGQWESFTAFKSNLPNDLPVINQGQISNIPNTGGKSWNSLLSQFARVNYSYGDRYLVTATIRRDGSSRFGPRNRWGVFPSVSAAWRLSNESFFASQSDLFSNVKLRLGWGQVGNQEISNYAFGSSLTTVNSYFGPSTRNSAYSNPDVQWEATTMTNVGLDVEMFNGRVDLSFDAYNKVTDNLLLRVNLPAIFGDQVQGPQANVGSMTNKGFEVALTTVNMELNKFRWTTTGNISVNRNEVTDIGGNPIFNNLYWYSGFQTATVTNAGFPVGQFYGYVMDGIFKTKEEILAHAVQIPSDEDPDLNKIERTTGVWLGDIKWKDINNDGRITSEDQTVIGDPNPDFTFGLNNSFSYGPFSLDVFVIGTVGGDILNYSRARNEQMLGIFDNQSVTVRNRAQIRLTETGSDLNNIDHVELVNPETNMPRFDNGGENFNHYMSTRWIEDGSYVRIQNVRLGYTLPQALLQKARLTKVHVYGNVQNVATFTDYSGLDPQIGAFNQSSLRQNIDMGRYPAPRVYTIGLNIEF